MAEFIMRDLVEQAGAAEDFFIASAATSSEEIGNGVYPPVKRILSLRGIDPSAKRARRITAADYDNYDLIIGMDNANIRNMLRFWDGDPERKIHTLLSYCNSDREVADPWYTDDFEATLRDVLAGCSAILEEYREKI